MISSKNPERPYVAAEAISVVASSLSANYHHWRANRAGTQSARVLNESAGLDVSTEAHDRDLAEAQREADFYAALGTIAIRVIVEENNSKFSPNLPRVPKEKDSFAGQADFWRTVDLHREFKSTSLAAVPFNRLPQPEQDERRKKASGEPWQTLPAGHHRDPTRMTLEEKLALGVPPKTPAEKQAEQQLALEIADINSRRGVQGEKRRMHGDSGKQYSRRKSNQYRKQQDKLDQAKYDRGELSYAQLNANLKARLTLSGKTAHPAHGLFLGKPEPGTSAPESLFIEAEKLESEGRDILKRIGQKQLFAQEKLIQIEKQLPEREALKLKLVDEAIKLERESEARRRKSERAKAKSTSTLNKIKDRWEERSIDPVNVHPVVERIAVKDSVWNALIDTTQSDPSSTIVGRQWRSFKGSETVIKQSVDGTIVVELKDKGGRVKKVANYSEGEFKMRLQKIPAERLEN